VGQEKQLKTEEDRRACGSRKQDFVENGKKEL